MAEKIPTHIESAPQPPAHGGDAGAANERAQAKNEAAVEAGSAKPPAGGAHAAPKVSVDGAAADQAEAAQAASGDAPGTKPASASAPAASQGAATRFSTWLHETFPNSTHAVIGGVCGLAIAIMLFTIGLFKTLVVAIFVIAGVAVGQYIDGDPKIVRIVQELMRRQ